ncbi:hypothetical protein GIB67_042690 [Kingdonia uniflora]|uniref:UVR domain-containing protein n=1 Tax=Kingdonia uniflora TaxID=39325 RepID=A0A7J7NDY5_9MAGN|nr:hypothetical protein GIB67_042690 [Kingdonia uniflora]
MQSLNLKVVTDFSSGVRRNYCNLSRRRTCKIITACSSSSSDNNGGVNQKSNLYISHRETYALLKQQMEVAAKSEDYKEAARIRDSIKIFEEEEPESRLKRLMKEAIADERFEDAAKYRDELKIAAPYSLLKCESDATTQASYFSLLIESRVVSKASKESGHKDHEWVSQLIPQANIIVPPYKCRCQYLQLEF